MEKRKKEKGKNHSERQNLTSNPFSFFLFPYSIFKIIIDFFLSCQLITPLIQQNNFSECCFSFSFN